MLNCSVDWEVSKRKCQHVSTYTQHNILACLCVFLKQQSHCVELQMLQPIFHVFKAAIAPANANYALNVYTRSFCCPHCRWLLDYLRQDSEHRWLNVLHVLLSVFVHQECTNKKIFWEEIAMDSFVEMFNRVKQVLWIQHHCVRELFPSSGFLNN